MVLPQHQGCSRDAPASLPLHYPMWYRSQRTLLDKVTPSLCKCFGRQGGAESSFFIFPSFLAFFRAAASKTLTPTAAAPSARLPCSVRDAAPLDSVISINICRCFRAGTRVGTGTPAGAVAFSHGIALLQRKQQMLPMDHGS